MTSSLFNPTTQYTENVDAINKEVESSAAADGAYYASLIKAEAEYDMNQAKGAIGALSDILGTTAKLHKEGTLRAEARAEDEFYEKGPDLEKHGYQIAIDDKKYNSVKDFNNSLTAKANLGSREHLEPGGDSVFAGMLALGDPDDNNKAMLIRSRRERYKEFFEVSSGEQGVKLTREDGTSFTLDSAKTWQERTAALRTIRRIWTLESIKDGSTAIERRKILHKEMQRVEQLSNNDWNEKNKKAIKLSKELKIEQDLGDIIKGDLPGENDVDIDGEYIKNDFMEEVRKNRTWYDKNGDLGVSRTQHVEKVKKMITSGSIDMVQTNNLLNSWFTGNDGQRHRFRDVYKKEARELLSAAVEYRRKDNVTRKEEVQGEIDKFDLDKKAMLAEQDGPVDQSQIDEIMDEFRANPKWRGYPVPSVVTDYYTKQAETNEGIKQRVLAKAAKLEPVDHSDFAGWDGDPEGLINIRNIVKATNLAALNSSEITTRDKYIATAASIKLGEQNALPGKNSLEYHNTIAGATKEYNKVYGATMATTGGDKVASNTKALDAVEAGIKAGTWEGRERKEISEDTTTAVSKTWALLKKNKENVNQRLPMVTDKDLEDSLAIVKNNGVGTYPASIRNIANVLGESQHNVALSQVNAKLKAEGLPLLTNEDGSQVTKAMTEAFDVPDQKKLQSGSMSKQNQVIVKNAENIQAYLDLVKDATAMNNGEYDYVQAPDGGDAHLEKPLTEHTIEEVYGLIRSGHGNLTAYAMSPRQFVEAVQASGLEMTDILDANTQDTLALFVARANLKHQNDSTGFYGSNEIAKLSKEERGTYSTILGTVPDDWNKLENLVDSRLFK